jgi:TolB-like protein
MAAILRDEPPPLPGADRKPGLEPIVRRCLEQRPADRFQSAEDLASALRRSLDAADAAPTPGVPSLAVLPFASPAGEVDQQLGFGMADALITRLGNIRRVLVRPTSAIRRYLTSAPDPAIAGRELRVDTVLEGCIQRSGEKLRVTVQLIDVQTGAPIWGEGFDESLADIFHVQDSISERLAASLVSSLTAAEKEHLQKRYTQNLDAYQSYLKGRYHWNKRTKEGLAKAVEYLSEAVRQDTGYALAHSALADCYTLLASAGYDVGDRSAALASARAAATKAIEIDSQMAEAHTSLGLVKFRGDWDWVGAEKEFRRAIELKPGDASAHHFCGLLLCAMGRQAEAIAAVKRAYELDPLSLIIGCAIGRVWHFGREYDRAIEQFRRVLEMDSSFAEAHFGLGVAYLQKSMLNDARTELEWALRLSGDRLLYLGFLGCVHAVSGNRTEAESVLKQLARFIDEGRITPSYELGTRIGLGQTERVFAILERAFEEQEGLLAFARVEPLFDPLRSDARFETMLRRAGLGSPG